MFLMYVFIGCKKELPSAPTCEEGLDTACFRGSFRTLLGSPVVDMKICAPEEENIECVWSDEEGTWKLPGLPQDKNVFLTAEHPDFVPHLVFQHLMALLIKRLAKEQDASGQHTSIASLPGAMFMDWMFPAEHCTEC